MRGPPPITESLKIHRAEWVVPVSAPPLPNGAVLTHKGRVMKVGPFPGIRRGSPAGAQLIDHGGTALFPATVNAHTHLELSALKGKVPLPQSCFGDWIAHLFAQRASMLSQSMADGLRNGEAELLNSGTTLCADITNGSAIETLASGPPSECVGPASHRADEAFVSLQRLIFLELLGFDADSIAAAMPPWLTMLDLDQSADRYPRRQIIPVPHAVYSVSPTVIAESKEWTRVHGFPFSMHVAEHLDEIEFLQEGSGFCRDLLVQVGRWDPAWNPPSRTPIEYLDSLDALDSLTLLVHAVHLSDADWALVAERHCSVVFCPRSNRNLGSGRPRIEKALSLGIRCALGTDSLASNTDLNLFAEAGFVLDEYPSIDPRVLLEMITVNAAESLGCRKDFGSIERGSKAHILAVDIEPGIKESNLAATIIESGKKGTWKWANCTRD